MLLLQPPRILCASTGHYAHLPSRESVQPATVRVPWYRDNFPGRTHGTPQAVATSCWPQPQQAHPEFCTPPSPWPEWARAPESATPITPSCLGEEQTPEGDLHAEVGPNAKLNTRNGVKKRRKREISPCSLRSSRINLHNQLDVSCICAQIDNELPQNWDGELWEQL